MKEKLKKQNGISKIALVLVIIVAIVLIGVGALTVRMLVTGDEFLAPIEEFFGAEENDDEDKESKKDKENKNDKEQEDEENKNDKEQEDKKENSKKDEEDDNIKHYHGEIDFEDFTGGNTLDYSDLIEMNVDFYTTDTEIVDMVLEFDLKEFLIEYYEKYEDEMVSSGFETYEDFRDLMMETFETSFASGFATSGSSESEIFDIEYPEEEIIKMTITDGGITQLYENYNLEEGDSIQDVLDGFEAALNIQLEEV